MRRMECRYVCTFLVLGGIREVRTPPALYIFGVDFDNERQVLAWKTNIYRLITSVGLTNERAFILRIQR